MEQELGKGIMAMADDRSNTGAEAMPVPPPPSTTRRRHRVLEVVGIVALVLIALAIVGAMTETSTDDTLLAEDFGSEPFAFTTDSDRFTEQTVEDGRYQVMIKDGSIPQLVRHVFAHTYDGMTFEATVVHPTGADGAVFASVGCWAGESAYVLMMTADGEVGLLETVRESTGERVDLTELVPAEAARTAGHPNRLRIDCVGGGSADTVVSGYVNGEPVLSVAIPDGYDSFDAVGFFLIAEHGGRFTIDDAVASAARPEPGMSPVPPVEASGL